MSYIKSEYQNTNNMKVQNHSKRTLVLFSNQFGIKFKHHVFADHVTLQFHTNKQVL